MTPDEQAVERVARAIMREAVRYGPDVWTRSARAAIAALARPKVGDGEAEAAYREGWADGWYAGDDSGSPPDEERISDDWQSSDLLERLTSP